MDEPPNYYHVLGIARLASSEQVRLAYIRLLKQHHPDRAGRAQPSERLHQVQRAYRCLRDTERRAEHDRLLQSREMAHARAVRRVRRRIRHLDNGRSTADHRATVKFGKLHALAAVSGGTVLLWLLLMG